MSIRFQVVILASLASLIFFGLRYNLSIAIVAMVNNTAFEEAKHSSTAISNECPEPERNETANYKEGNFMWSPVIRGIVLSSYFYGYSTTQIIGGRFAEKWGGKLICGIGVLCSSLISLLTPLAAEWIPLILTVRFLIGAFHGVIFSSLYTLFIHWIPDKERTTAIGFIMSGGNVGAAIILPITGFFCENTFMGGWPAAFYVTAIVGCLWSFIWFVCVTDLPENHPRISKKEVTLIKESTTKYSTTKSSVPWIKVFSSTAVWASVVAKATGSFGYYVITTEFPTYLKSIYNVSIDQNGYLNAYVYLLHSLSIFFSGKLADFIREKNVISVTLLRKIFQGIAMTVPAVCLVLVQFAKCDKYYAIGLIMTSMFFYGFICGGELPIITEFAPDFSGTIFGFSNITACIDGLLAPTIVGILLNENINDRKQWNVVFNITAGLYVFGFVFFSIFATAVPTKWGFKNKESKTATNDNENTR